MFAACKTSVARSVLPSLRGAPLHRTPFLPTRRVLFKPLRQISPRHERSFATQIRANIKTGQSLDAYPEYFNKVTASDGATVSLSSYKNKNPVVLFFYPKAGTPGCTKQAQTFRDQYQELKKLGAVVFGISGDTLAEQKTFAAAQNLPFPLLVDADDALRKGLGIPGDLFGALPGRQTIVIDKSGICILSYNNQFSPETHASEAIKALSTA